jgi:glycosyltransferase involved in cell wall biosynthesis
MVVASLAARARTEIEEQTGMAAEPVRRRTPSAAGRPSLRVAWVGPRWAWLELDGARTELEGVELRDIGAGERPSTSPQVVHVARSAVGELERLRGTLRESRFVLDLTDEDGTVFTRAQARQAVNADAVFAGSRWELAELCRRHPGLPAHTSVVGRPLDLEWYAPEAEIAEMKLRGRDLRRFRRFHRLAGPVILFAGPYVEAGGFDLLLEAAFRLREAIPELRVAAIPHGPTDPRYRDRCEMRALGLGHRGIVEWSPAPAEVSFWYATATVVCGPARAPGSGEPAKRAAASGRPFVGSDLEPFREHLEDDQTGHLVPAGDLDALQSSLEEVLHNEDEASRLGEAARRKAEAEYSPAVAARQLRREWELVLEARPRSTGDDSRLVR